MGEPCNVAIIAPVIVAATSLGIRFIRVMHPSGGIVEAFSPRL